MRKILNKDEVISCIKGIIDPKEYIKFAYIFGSYAENREKKDSDIDIGLFLSGIGEENFFTIKIEIQLEIQEIIKKTVDVVIMNTAPPLLNHEIFKNGIIIKNDDPALLSQFRAKNFYYYLDQMYIINSYLKSVKEKIGMNLNNG